MRSLTDLLVDFRRSREAMEQVVKNVPRIIGVEAVRAVKGNFLIESYFGEDKWVPRSEKTNKAYMAGRTKGKQGRYKGSVFSASKPLLRQTLALFNSITYKAYGSRVFIGTNLSLIPYGQIHNEGGRGIPKRQYMPLPGQPINRKLLLLIDKKIIFERNKAMRLFK